ncbi:lysine decarboxylase family protein [Klebsiella pneumoniae]|uniref:AMP nucleosidase n=1 Tax=Klebsiella pneumoniae TaxID=573 RepID=A0A2X3EDU4_KLEPN|nr:lysine decarboxylase family protein [Klebsiella pneumoniae]
MWSEDMHERKTKMAALADGFIALPGGAGTLEEIFETMDLGAAGGSIEKPCAFLNIKGYYDPLQAMVDNMVREGFMHPRYAEMLPFATSADEIIAGFRDYTPPARKWVQQPAI